MIKLYRKGADKERRFVKAAKEVGKIAFRSAGSHSPIDVCIIDRENKKVKFIQCKPTNFPESQKLKLENELNWLNDEFLVSFSVL